LGGAGFDFAGNYTTKGLYSYRESNEKYFGKAYFGMGGTEAEMDGKVREDFGQYRPHLEDASTEETTAATSTAAANVATTAKPTVTTAAPFTTTEVYDCSVKPASMNGGKGFPHGCEGARWSDGKFSADYCQGDGGRFGWWAACCDWTGSECVPIPGVKTAGEQCSEDNDCASGACRGGNCCSNAKGAVNCAECHPYTDTDRAGYCKTCDPGYAWEKDVGCVATEAPTLEPTAEPTFEPTAEPTLEPTAEPTFEPTAEPTLEPTAEPTLEPTAEPTLEPTAEPTLEPTEEPTLEPTEEPTLEPTEAPAPAPGGEAGTDGPEEQGTEETEAEDDGGDEPADDDSAGTPETPEDCYITYCNTYPDLQRAFCGGHECDLSNLDRCQRHWNKHGRKETMTGRRKPALGDPPDPDLCVAAVDPAGKCYITYCNAYPDLQNAFCRGDECGPRNRDSCERHWNKYGKKETAEGRRKPASGEPPNPDHCLYAWTQGPEGSTCDIAEVEDSVPAATNEATFCHASGKLIWWSDVVDSSAIGIACHGQESCCSDVVAAAEAKCGGKVVDRLTCKLAHKDEPKVGPAPATGVMMDIEVAPELQSPQFEFNGHVLLCSMFTYAS
jgi:hypothetical protein